jgi:hypothetical protein
MLAIPHSSALPVTGGVVTGIPDLSQLNEPTLDGAADENTRDNCVFTCNADLSRYFDPAATADGDAIKDSIPAYGQGYTGFASQDTVIASGMLEKRWGTHSYRVNALDRGALLRTLIGLANAGTPSIVTIPSLWNSEPKAAGYDPNNARDARGGFFCHACVFAGTLADGTCVLCNPWGGFLMYYSQADMALRLCFLCAYPVVKATVETMANTTGLGVGFANYANAHNADVAIPETFEHGFSWATLKNGTILRYAAGVGVQDNQGASVLAYVQAQRIILEHATPTPAPAAPPNVKAQVATLETDLAVLVKALGTQAA